MRIQDDRFRTGIFAGEPRGMNVEPDVFRVPLGLRTDAKALELILQFLPVS